MSVPKVEWMALSPDGIAVCYTCGVESTSEREGIHGKATIIGVDLAKDAFQVHDTAADRSVLFRKKLSRPQFVCFAASRVWTG